MFLGEYQIKFSGQGRLILPKKFREELIGENEIILSRGLDGCIFGFNKIAWELEVGKYLEKPLIDRKSRDLRRYIFSAAEKIELDSQGRFIVPSVLLNYAGIKKDIAMIGSGDHFELWDRKKWMILKKQFLIKSEQ